MGDAQGRQGEDTEGKGLASHREYCSQRSGEKNTSLYARLGTGGK
jgi:hypothetical protein